MKKSPRTHMHVNAARKQAKWQRIKEFSTTHCELPLGSFTDLNLLDRLRQRNLRALGPLPLKQGAFDFADGALKIKGVNADVPESAIGHGCPCKILLSEFQGAIRLEIVWERWMVLKATAAQAADAIKPIKLGGKGGRKGPRGGPGRTSLLPTTAMFVTDQSKPHKVSGGLPSLGKKR